ncbi:MAG: helix-turn-helix domain-containing protein [bacterium]|nr:helix-turn-helix domain-containing protein [bacterium]
MTHKFPSPEDLTERLEDPVPDPTGPERFDSAAAEASRPWDDDGAPEPDPEQKTDEPSWFSSGVEAAQAGIDAGETRPIQEVIDEAFETLDKRPDPHAIPPAVDPVDGATFEEYMKGYPPEAPPPQADDGPQPEQKTDKPQWFDGHPHGVSQEEAAKAREELGIEGPPTGETRTVEIHDELTTEPNCNVCDPGPDCNSPAVDQSSFSKEEGSNRTMETPEHQVPPAADAAQPVDEQGPGAVSGPHGDTMRERWNILQAAKDEPKLLPAPSSFSKEEGSNRTMEPAQPALIDSLGVVREDVPIVFESTPVAGKNPYGDYPMPRKPSEAEKMHMETDAAFPEPDELAKDCPPAAEKLHMRVVQDPVVGPVTIKVPEPNIVGALPMQDSFGQDFAAARAKRGMKQVDAANLLGFPSQATISQIERDRWNFIATARGHEKKYRAMRKQLEAVAAFMGRTVESLLTDNSY